MTFLEPSVNGPERDLEAFCHGSPLGMGERPTELCADGFQGLPPFLKRCRGARPRAARCGLGASQDAANPPRSQAGRRRELADAESLALMLDNVLGVHADGLCKGLAVLCGILARGLQ